MPRTVDLDVSELVCPETVAAVRRCLAEMEPGETLVVTGEDPSVARTIRRTCYKHGFDVSETERKKEGFALAIRITDSASLEPRED